MKPKLKLEIKNLERGQIWETSTSLEPATGPEPKEENVGWCPLCKKSLTEAGVWSSQDATYCIKHNIPIKFKPITISTTEPTIASAPATPASAPTVPMQEKKEPTPKLPEIEINNFIDEFDLKPLLPLEFEGLKEEQKLKVVRDLKRRIVDIVKSDAQTQYSEDLKTKTAASINPSAFREFIDKTKKGGRTLKDFLKFNADAVVAGVKGVGNISKAVGRTIKTSAIKERDLKKFEEKVFGELRNTHEELIRRDLERLTEIVRKKDIVLSTGGNPFVCYINTYDLLNSTEEEEFIFSNFNQKAFEFTKIPYEYGQEKGKENKKGKIKGTKNRERYEKAKAEYKKAREKVLEIKKTRVGPEKALTEMLEIDNAIQMEQLLNTHPEFEKALDDFGRSAGGKELTKRTLKSFFTSNSATKANIGIGITGAGVRFGAKVGLGFTTFAASGMFVAAPIIGAATGYWRGKIRGKKTLEERKKGARHGQKDENKEANKIVRADNMAKYLDNIIQELNGSCTDKKRIALVERLKIRIIVTQEKIERGLMDFGDAQSALKNQFDLVNNLNAAIIEQYKHEHGKDLKERIEKLLSFRSDKINEAQDAFVKKQALRGAAMGAGFATAGYALRYAWEHVHFGGEHGIGWGNPADNLKEIDLQLHKNQGQIEELQKQLEELKRQMNGGKSSLTPNPKTPNPFAAYAAETPAQKIQRIEAAIEKLKADNAKLEALKNTTGAKPATSHTPSGENKFIHKPNGNVEEKLPDGTTRIYDKNWKILEERYPNNSLKKEYYSGGERLRYEKLSDGTRKDYYPDGKLARVISPDKSSTVYDGDGTVKSFDSDGIEIKSAPSETLEAKPDTLNAPATPKPQPSAPTNETPDTTAPKPPAAPAHTQPPATPPSETPTAPETPTPAVSHGEISTEFSIKLGTDGVPKNLETVFNAISANHLSLPANGIVDQEFAAKSLNMAANLVKLTEGHGGAGITAEEWGKAANFWDGKLEIKDHQAFNNILTKLQEHANQNWANGVLQSKGAASSYVPNISHDGWLKIIHADGLDKAPGGINTGIVGHDEITGEKIKDFGHARVVDLEKNPTMPKSNSWSEITTASEDEQLGTEYTATEMDALASKGLASDTASATEQAAFSKSDAIEEARQKVMAGIKPSGEENEFGGHVDQSPKPMVEEKHIFSSSNSKEYKGGDKFFRDLSPMEERTLRRYPEFAKNPFHLTKDKLIEAYNTHQRNLGHIFQHNTDISGAWKEWRGLRASTILENKNFDKNNPLITYLHRLQEVTKLKPQGGFLTHKETIDEYMARALQKAEQLGKTVRLNVNNLVEHGDPHVKMGATSAIQVTPESLTGEIDITKALNIDTSQLSPEVSQTIHSDIQLLVEEHNAPDISDATKEIRFNKIKLLLDNPRAFYVKQANILTKLVESPDQPSGEKEASQIALNTTLEVIRELEAISK